MLIMFGIGALMGYIIFNNRGGLGYPLDLECTRTALDTVFSERKSEEKESNLESNSKE